MQPIRQRTETTVITPIAADIEGVDNPTETRYGYTPYRDIYLYGGDGMPNYFIQPTNSPFHREIPKGQLIPFETFTRTYREATGAEGVPGSPVPLAEMTTTVTAHSAATTLLRGYAGSGYTMLRSLQGMAQEDAFRIFSVVQPFKYLLYELIGELQFGALERIEATSVIDLGGDYTLEPLQNDTERNIAMRLQGEMAASASLAFDFATAIFNQTEAEINACLSGKKEGKKGGDNLDLYLSVELNRTLPKLTQNATVGASDHKLDYLVEREQDRTARERSADLDAREKALEERERASNYDTVAELLTKAEPTAAFAEPTATESIPSLRMACSHIKTNGEQCRGNATFDGKCASHR